MAPGRQRMVPAPVTRRGLPRLSVGLALPFGRALQAPWQQALHLAGSSLTQQAHELVVPVFSYQINEKKKNKTGLPNLSLAKYTK